MLQYSISIYLLYGCPNCAASIVLANFVVACWCSLHFSKGGGASFQRASFLGAVYGPQWAPTCSRESLLVPGSRLSMRAAKHINTIQYMSLLEESPESDMKNGASELRSKSGKGWLAPSKSTKHASSASSATASAVGWQLKIRGGCYACCNIIKMTFQKKMLIWFKQGQKKKSIWATLSAESMARPIVWVHLSKLHRKKHHSSLATNPVAKGAKAWCALRASSLSEHNQRFLRPGSAAGDHWEATHPQKMEKHNAATRHRMSANQKHRCWFNSPWIQELFPSTSNFQPTLIQIQQAISALTWLPEISEAMLWQAELQKLSSMSNQQSVDHDICTTWTYAHVFFTGSNLFKKEITQAHVWTWWKWR